MTDFRFQLQPQLGAVNIIETVDAVTPTEDWSGVRSKGRARRRRKQGHRQNIRVYGKPACFKLPNGDLIIHPKLAAALRHRVRSVAEAKVDEMALALILGRPLT